jgi:hypothetical protein
MQQQDSFSNTELEQKYNKLTSRDGKFNITSIFLTKFLFGANFDSLKKAGLVNSYIEDPQVQEMIDIVVGPDVKLLFLLFRNNKLSTDMLKNIVQSLLLGSSTIVMTYELINNYSMIVLSYPSKFKEDFNKIVGGKYSKLSEDFKSRFPETRDALDSEGKVLGKEYTLYYHIFNKTDWLKKFWLKRLDLVELNEDLELWEKPQQEDLIFNIKIIEKK